MIRRLRTVGHYRRRLEAVERAVRNIGPPLWGAKGECLHCGYVPKMGNRRTHESRRNWVRYCRTRHEAKHAKDRP